MALGGVSSLDKETETDWDGGIGCCNCLRSLHFPKRPEDMVKQKRVPNKGSHIIASTRDGYDPSCDGLIQAKTPLGIKPCVIQEEPWKPRKPCTVVVCCDAVWCGYVCDRRVGRHDEDKLGQIGRIFRYSAYPAI